jgi:hypothetical protein
MGMQSSNNTRKPAAKLFKLSNISENIKDESLQQTSNNLSPLLFDLTFHFFLVSEMLVIF